jgi:hypothetical protein
MESGGEASIADSSVEPKSRGALEEEVTEFEEIKVRSGYGG